MLGADTSTTTTTTNKSTSINDLAPKLLELIFSHLPLGQLLRLHLVCKQWATVQHSLCASLYTVSLCIGEDIDDDHEVLLSSQFSSSSSFSIPHVELLSTSDEGVNCLPTISSHPNLSACLQFSWLDIEAALLITEKLPNVRSLTLSLQSASLELTVGERSWQWRLRLIDSLAALFKQWSTQLTSLKLFINFKLADPSRPIVGETINGLFRLINGCSALRHLTVEGQNAFFLNEQQQKQQGNFLNVDLPVFGWLEELYFNWWSFNSSAVKSLVRYGPANGRLRSVNFTDFYELDLAATFGQAAFAPLRSKFHQFSAFQLCRSSVHWEVFSRNFTFLRKLWVGVYGRDSRHEVGQLAEVLSHMENLLYVDLLWSCKENWTAKGDDNTDDDDDDNQLMVKPLTAVTSVKILKFYAPAVYCHSSINAIHWETLFPNLEVLHFVDGQKSCKRCDQDDLSRNGCLQATLKAWSRCPRLSYIYSISKNSGGSTKSWDLAELR